MMNDDIIHTDSYDFDERTQKGVVLVFFYSEYCVHSRGLEPILDEIADEYYDNIRVVALDIEQSPDIASRFKIESTPVVIILRNGKISDRIEGANPPSTYAEYIDEVLLEYQKENR